MKSFSRPRPATNSRRGITGRLGQRSVGGGGGVGFGGGAAQVDGASFGPTATFGPGSSLEFLGTFGLASFQHAGFTDDFNSTWAIFSTSNTTGTLFARVNPGSDVTIPGAWIGTPHRYRIDWTPGSIVFSIDGTVVSTQPYGGAGPLRALASDFATGGPVVAMDWMRVLPNAASGSFTSRVFDGGASTNWGAMTWASSEPAGTSLAMLVRTGDTPAPDGTWTPFSCRAGERDHAGRHLSLPPVPRRSLDLGSSCDAGARGRSPIACSEPVFYAPVITNPSDGEVVAAGLR